MGNQEVRFKLDSGADANVLPLDTYERLGSGSPLMKTNTVLTAFGWQCQDPARVRGKVTSRQSTYIRDADAGFLRHTVVRYRHTRMQSLHRVGSSAQSISGHCCRE